MKTRTIWHRESAVDDPAAYCAHLERLLRRASVALQAAGKRTPLVAEIQAACGVHTPRSGLLARLRRAWAALVR